MGSGRGRARRGPRAAPGRGSRAGAARAPQLAWPSPPLNLGGGKLRPGEGRSPAQVTSHGGVEPDDTRGRCSPAQGQDRDDSPWGGGGAALHLLSTHCLSRHPLPLSLNAALRAPRGGARGVRAGSTRAPSPQWVPALTPRRAGWVLYLTFAQTPERESLSPG